MQKIKLLAATLLSLLALAAYAAQCEIDGSSMRFTGEVKTVQGVLLKKYVCPQGHTAWAR